MLILAWLLWTEHKIRGEKLKNCVWICSSIKHLTWFGSKVTLCSPYVFLLHIQYRLTCRPANISMLKQVLSHEFWSCSLGPAAYQNRPIHCVAAYWEWTGPWCRGSAVLLLEKRRKKNTSSAAERDADCGLMEGPRCDSHTRDLILCLRHFPMSETHVNACHSHSHTSLIVHNVTFLGLVEFGRGCV